MPIPLRRQLAEVLIKRRSGSIQQFEIDWREGLADGRLPHGTAANSASIYRWLKEGIPDQADKVFGFAAALGVDPVTLIDADAIWREGWFANERRLFQLGRPEKGHLSPLWAIYTAEHDWPDHDLVTRYYGHRWHIQHFTHEATDPATINADAAILFTNDGTHDFTEPRAYHFAYRNTSGLDQRWRPYGTVLGYADTDELLHEKGHHQRVQRQHETLIAETHFGRGVAEFRVVSLHPFSLSVEAPSMRKGCVRFPF